jgi:hypothetical protein
MLAVRDGIRDKLTAGAGLDDGIRWTVRLGAARLLHR